MSVAAFNKFALLDDEDGKGSLGLATAKSKATAASPAEPQKTQQQTKTGPASRSGRYYARGGGPKPQATDSNAAAAAEESTLPTQRFDRTEGRHDRGGRGRGGEFRGRGEGRGRGRGGRPYRDDRHSKTGIVDTSKQVSQGWGGTDGNNELAVESAAEKDAQEETKAEGGASWGEDAPAASWGGEGAPPGDAAAAPEGEKAAVPAEPEEDNTMTLDEYLAKKAETGLSGLVGSAQIRKANEGAGDDLFKGAQQLVREEEEVDDFYVGKPKTQRAPKAKEVKEKITIEIDGQFADSNPRGGRGRGRGGRGDFRGDFRGGRGDFRGGRGRGGDRDRGDRPDRGGRGGGYRGGRNAGPRALDVADEKAFPSLG